MNVLFLGGQGLCVSCFLGGPNLCIVSWEMRSCASCFQKARICAGVTSCQVRVCMCVVSWDDSVLCVLFL